MDIQSALMGTFGVPPQMASALEADASELPETGFEALLLGGLMPPAPAPVPVVVPSGFGSPQSQGTAFPTPELRNDVLSSVASPILNSVIASPEGAKQSQGDNLQGIATPPAGVRNDDGEAGERLVMAQSFATQQSPEDNRPGIALPTPRLRQTSTGLTDHRNESEAQPQLALDTPFGPLLQEEVSVELKILPKVQSAPVAPQPASAPRLKDTAEVQMTEERPITLETMKAKVQSMSDSEARELSGEERPPEAPNAQARPSREPEVWENAEGTDDFALPKETPVMKDAGQKENNVDARPFEILDKPQALIKVERPDGVREAGEILAAPTPLTPASVDAPDAPAAAPVVRAEVTAQVVSHFKAAIADGVHRFEVTLKPEDLGRLDVEVAFAADGGVDVVVRIEKPETFAFLKDDAGTHEQLRQALQESGIHADQQNFTFLFQEQNRPGTKLAQDLAREGGNVEEGSLEDVPPHEAPKADPTKIYDVWA